MLLQQVVFTETKKTTLITKCLKKPYLKKRLSFSSTLNVASWGTHRAIIQQVKHV